MIRATNAHQAVRFAVYSDVTVKAASANDVADYLGRGICLESAIKEVASETSSESTTTLKDIDNEQ